MLLITDQAKLVCRHRGSVSIEASQELVTIARQPILVEDDPEGRRISWCPNFSITIKPCGKTLAVVRGYSNLLRIAGKRVCLDSIAGLTDGTPPRMVEYIVKEPGQQFVFEGK